MTISELIERLEKATGPNYQLEIDIYKFVNPEYSNYIQGRGGLVHPNDGEDQRVLSQIRPSNYTASIDAAVYLVKTLLPGWAWRVATCSVSDDAWVIPDFNCPVHGERLKASFRQDIDWTDITDVDMRPAGNPAIALCLSVLLALKAIEDTKGETA